MKVLHIVKTAVGANWAYEQVRVLCSLGIEVVVALPSDTEGLAPKYRQAGATVLRANLDLPSSEPWRIPATLRVCRQLVADVRPDLIHTHHVGTTFVVRLALGKNSKIPRVFQVPGPLHLEHPFFAWLDISLSGPRDSWIATCESTREKYRAQAVAPQRIFLSRIGMDAIQVGARKNDKLRQALGIPLDAPVVGMVAHMYAPKFFLGQTRGVKGHEDFIAALALIKKIRPDVRGVIVGGSWQKSGTWYEERLQSLGKRFCGSNLLFLGHRTDLDEVSGVFDISVQPSLSEAIAWSVAELLQRNIPVIATRVGGLPDLIQENKTGWLVPPRNPEAIARAVLEALGNPEEAQRRTARGRDLARSLLNVERTGREIANIYEQCLGVAYVAAMQRDAAVTQSHPSRPRYEVMAQRRLRVLHALGTMDPGGVETWLLSVLKCIDPNLLEFHFCTFGPKPGLFAGEVERLGGRMLPCPRGLNPWSFARRFRRILRDGKYDVVHSHVTLFSGVVLRCAEAEGVPMRIAHSHASEDDKPDTPPRRFYRQIMKSWIDRYATHGLAVSRSAASELFGRNWKADARFRVLHCGIDLSPFQVPTGRDEVRRELGLPLDVPIVGHVGRFVPAKNHRFLLEIFGALLKKRSNIHLLLVGDGFLRPKTEAQAKSMGLSGNVHFVGTRTDVPRLMRGGMDVFVFPSLWEGLPVALIEAQAAGLPSVVSDTVTNEAVVLSDQFSQLPLSKRPDEWASQAVEALQKGKAEASWALQAVAQSDFCIQRSSSTLASLYATTVGQ